MNHHRITLALLLLCMVPAVAVAQSLTWEPLGPVSGVYGGLTIDSGGTIYAYKWQGGIVRSTDMGSNWELVADQTLGSLVAAGRDTAYQVDDKFVLRRTTDAGLTWGVLSDRITTIAVAPDGLLYASQGRYYNTSTTLFRFSLEGVPLKLEGSKPTGMALVGSSGTGALFGLGVDSLFRSEDRGDSWQLVMTGVGEMHDFFGRGPAGRLYLVKDDSKVFRSNDDGVTWLKTGEIPNRTGIVMGTAVGDDGSIYIGQGDRKFMRSTDEGATWSVMSNETVTTLLRVPGGLLGSSLQLQMARTSDGGATWTESNTGLPGERITTVVATSDTAAVVWLNAQVRLTMHVGDSVRWFGGNRLTGADFTRSNDGRVFIYDYNTHRVYRTSDQGATWDSSAVVDAGFGMHLAVDREGRLVGALEGLYRSTDLGDTWSALDTSTEEYINGVAIDSSGRIIAARGRGLAWFDEATKQWQEFADFPEVQYGASRIAVMPDGTLFALVWNEGICRSVDGGATWTLLEFSKCFDFAVSRNGLLVVVDGDRIVASRDRGTTFFEIGQDLWFGAISLSISPGGRIFAGTPFGLYRSSESMLSAPHEVRAGDRGSELGSLALQPNPARDQTVLSFMLPHRTSVRITIVDASGRERLHVLDEVRDAGAGQAMLDLSSLAEGAYIVRLEAGDFTIARTLVKR